VMVSSEGGTTLISKSSSSMSTSTTGGRQVRVRHSNSGCGRIGEAC
jgi:hypothetical protein